jgi:lambda repressor-like predicted transcriptional regulator
VTDTETELRDAAADLVAASARRDVAVVAMREAGASLRQIAKAAGLSPQGVVRILERRSSSVAG